jgi:hypothetical protein
MNVPMATSFSPATFTVPRTFSTKIANRFYRDTTITTATKVKEKEEKRKIMELQQFEKRKKVLQMEVIGHKFFFHQKNILNKT